MADYHLAKALKRKIDLDDEFLSKIKGIPGEKSHLMNPSRRRIFGYICNFPCCHLRKIARACGYSAQNAKWHLNKLTQAGLITEREYGKKKIYSPLKDIIGSEECKALELLNRNDFKQVYLFMVNQPKKTQKEIGYDLGIYQQKLSRILISLENNDLITTDKRQRWKIYSPTTRIHKLAKDFDLKDPTFKMSLIEALAQDSLNPKLVGSDHNIIKINVDIGPRKAILKINKNPFKALIIDNQK